MPQNIIGQMSHKNPDFIKNQPAKYWNLKKHLCMDEAEYIELNTIGKLWHIQHDRIMSTGLLKKY